MSEYSPASRGSDSENNGREYLQSPRQLPNPFLEYVLEQEWYDRIANSPDADEYAIGEAKARVEVCKQTAIASGGQPFGLIPTPHEEEIAQTLFPFLRGHSDQGERNVRETVTKYRSPLAGAWRQLQSRDENQRAEAYRILSEPHPEVEQALLGCIRRHVNFMQEQAGSVDSFFRTVHGVECFDPDQLFNNPQVNDLLTKIGRVRVQLLDVPQKAPYDIRVSVLTSKDALDLLRPDLKETAARIVGPFLRALGLEDLQEYIEVEPGAHSQSGLVHIGPDHEPRSFIQIESNLSQAVQERTIIHELGHAAERQVADRLPDLTGAHQFKRQGLAGLLPELDEWPAKLTEALFCSEEGARMFNFNLAERIEESPWYRGQGYSPMAANLKFLEFTYRLYTVAERCMAAGVALTADDANKLYAQIQQKYHQVVYPPTAGEPPVDPIWRYAVGQQLPFQPFALKAYVLGSAFANSTLEMFRKEGLKLGSPGFSEAFSVFFRRLFSMGPYLRVSDGMQQLGIDLRDEIPRQLHAELRRELRSLLLVRRGSVLSASADLSSSDWLLRE